MASGILWDYNKTMKLKTHDETGYSIRNPVIRGFNPDPSIIRVQDDYYIVTSTFEWFPGVPIYHSRDLAHWRLIGHALTRKSQLDLLGVPDSGGIWAPSLSCCDGIYYLVYTVVKTWNGPFKDVHNYLVTSNDITGPWSDPVFLNSSGFDPSLFHDDDGRKWLVNIQWDYRTGKSRFAGILLQEYDPVKKRLAGHVRNVLKKEALIEGPNIYKRRGFYYLMVAEGGTSWNHSISMARSKSIGGPYELDPLPALLTSRGNPELALQKSGHGELVETQSGEWYLAHLCSRPVLPQGRCILGRETAIQKCVWTEDGWLRLASGKIHPEEEVRPPVDLKIHPFKTEPELDDFDSRKLSPAWQTLRSPADDSWLSLDARPGWLRLKGGESIHSIFEQSLVAKRLTSLDCSVETCVEFLPDNFTQAAGLILWYNTLKHYFLRISHDESRGTILGIVMTDNGRYDEFTGNEISIGDWKRVFMKATIDHANLQFYFSYDGNEWKGIGPVLDASVLSDDYGPRIQFTGTFAGLCIQDLGGSGKVADFDYLTIRDESGGNCIKPGLV
jgi:xylan 1,4-beta-xylosidase